jgi:hypothetical protein
MQAIFLNAWFVLKIMHSHHRAFSRATVEISDQELLASKTVMSNTMNSQPETLVIGSWDEPKSKTA